MEKTTQRLVCNVPSDLMEKLDKYSYDLGVNRSAAVIFLLNSALDMKKGMDTMGQMMPLLDMLDKK